MDTTTTVATHKRALAEGRATLRESFFAHPSPRHLLKQHTALVDRILKSVWAESAVPLNTALVAVGGYGRGQLFPASDIDVLFLLPDEIDDVARDEVSELVGKLWDIGLDIGQSARSVAQCLDEAAHDLTVQTTLLEARFLIGNRALARRQAVAIREALDPKSFFEGKLLEQQHRHGRFADTAYNLEPNVKETPGGLRDLNNILWVSAANGMGTSWSELADRQIINTEEARQLTRHERTLQDLRIRLHYQAKRREDRLLFDLQAPLAAQVGLVDTDAKRASEQLMQRYYRTARGVTLLNEIILQNLRVRIFPSPSTAPVKLNERFEGRNELLEAIDDTIYAS